MFEDYEENSEREIDFTETDSATEHPTMNEDIERLLKAIKCFERKNHKTKKKLRKMGIKMNKMYKTFKKTKREDRTKFDDEKDSTKHSTSNQNNKKQKDRKTEEKEERPFLKRLGDVLLKALPGLLTTVVSVTLRMFFERGFGKKQNWRAASV